jgi:hypothetical protein
MHETVAAFAGPRLAELRRQQAELLAVIPPDIREPLMPDVTGNWKAPDQPVVTEMALRERVADLVSTDERLGSYLERARRHVLATAIVDMIGAHYNELAADAPMAMDEELGRARTELDPAVPSPSYEEMTDIAKLVPLIAWADHLQSLGTSAG